jgi:hypothetical protein
MARDHGGDGDVDMADMGMKAREVRGVIPMRRAEALAMYGAGALGDVPVDHGPGVPREPC